MKLSKLQETTIDERMNIIKKFQKTYPTSEDKINALKSMSNSDINFLIYCMGNIHGKIFYAKYLKK